ncbi:MAG: hypothetical protein ACI4B9_05815 [Eggerthellaceae bacterium]
MAKHAQHSQPKKSWFGRSSQRKQNAAGGVPTPENREESPSGKAQESALAEETPADNPTAAEATVGQEQNSPSVAAENAQAPAAERPRLSGIPEINAPGSESHQKESTPRKRVPQEGARLPESTPAQDAGAAMYDPRIRSRQQHPADPRANAPQQQSTQDGPAPRTAGSRPNRLNIPPIDPAGQDAPRTGAPDARQHPGAGTQPPVGAPAYWNPAATGSVPVYGAPAYTQPAPYGAPAYVQYAPNGTPMYVHYAPGAAPMYIPYPPSGNPAQGAYPGPYAPPAVKQEKSRRLGCLIPAIAVPVTLFAVVALFAITRPSFAQPLIEGAFGIQETAPIAASEGPVVFEDISDVAMTEEAAQAEQQEQVHTRRLLAQCQGVDIYSPISQDELTGVIMHQASYEWGQVMTTQAPQADMAEYEASGKPLRVNNEQTDGLWVDADIAHLYRDTDDTAMDTAADVGGEAGTTVYAPVTGQVIAVESYDLYDETPDIRIHIRPDANPDLDVVLLHQTDPTVQAGDRVEAGITPVSSVRDIAAELTDLQLAYYTQTAGNHSHVQVNDLTNPDYIAKYNLQVD